MADAQIGNDQTQVPEVTAEWYVLCDRKGHTTQLGKVLRKATSHFYEF